MSGPVVMLKAFYAKEPDVVHLFDHEGDSIVFGRDPELCDITIWSALNSQGLSRMAGRIWRFDDELWLRNLSVSHELQILVPGGPPEPPVPARRDDGIDKGPARSIPHGVALVIGPDGCRIDIGQERDPIDFLDELDGMPTDRVPRLTKNAQHVANALCAPLLAGGRLPASYHELTQALGVSQKVARTKVAELCETYAPLIPGLLRRVEERTRRQEAQLAVPVDPPLIRGVRRFDLVQLKPADAAAEAARCRALSLPDYYEIAHFLVRFRLVTPPNQ